MFANLWRTVTVFQNPGLILKSDPNSSPDELCRNEGKHIGLGAHRTPSRSGVVRKAGNDVLGCSKPWKCNFPENNILRYEQNTDLHMSTRSGHIPSHSMRFHRPTKRSRIVQIDNTTIATPTHLQNVHVLKACLEKCCKLTQTGGFYRCWNLSCFKFLCQSLLACYASLSAIRFWTCSAKVVTCINLLR